MIEMMMDELSSKKKKISTLATFVFVFCENQAALEATSRALVERCQSMMTTCSLSLSALPLHGMDVLVPR